ncbi:Glu/Leu/Phe/Val dehydrogenase family protein [Mumia sp. Pv 4-285]|uniref:Glu/Leu/Phe/Val dehydrogenase family protein n=1 Tax=Mumia qirimensis TaxID=3234852 RepID=UPI00351D6E9E
MGMETVIEHWDGRVCCSRYDAETGAFLTVAIHSRQLGPATGGTRAMAYPSRELAVGDATRLASSMTHKMAVAGLPMGGGKSVIALPRDRREIGEADWHRILVLHAETLATLNGSYWTGPDVGTSSADMDVLHGLSGGYAFGRSEAAGGPGSSAPETAHGVYVGIRESAREVGISDLAGRRVLVQGLGAVGMDVARRVAADGARLIASDIDPLRCEVARTELDAEIVAVDDVVSTACDVFVPCATGGVIDRRVASTLETRVVAGSANNVLADDAAADVLASRGIVLAPDFVINSGGGIHLVGREVLGWTADEVSLHVERIGRTLAEVFERARTERTSTDLAARRLADDVLARSTQSVAS